MAIRKRKWIGFIENPKGDPFLQAKDKVCVTLIRDFGKKRIDMVLNINAPHFYRSINGMPFNTLRNAREQLICLMAHCKTPISTKG